MSRRRKSRSIAARVAVAAAAAVALGGCALGQRPTITDERLLDDDAVEPVLARLDNAAGVEFTAVYAITASMDGVAPAEATVTNRPGNTKVVFRTDGQVTVEYVTVDGEQRTCQQGESECVAGLDESRISNLGAITSSFWGVSTAQKLRLDAGRKVGPSTPATTPVADQTATCVTLPIGTGVNTEYCALDAGPLARYGGADGRIELIDFSIG